MFFPQIEVQKVVIQNVVCHFELDFLLGDLVYLIGFLQYNNIFNS